MRTVYSILAFLGIGIIVIGLGFLGYRKVSGPKQYDITEKQVMDIYSMGYASGAINVSKTIGQASFPSWDDSLATKVDKLDSVYKVDSTSFEKVYFKK